MPITMETGVGEVFWHRGATVLFAYYVVNFATVENIHLVDQTILAEMISPLCYESS